jgi:hypothetical protein
MTDLETASLVDPTRMVTETIRVIVVTGILYGVVVAGIGSRLVARPAHRRRLFPPTILPVVIIPAAIAVITGIGEIDQVRQLRATVAVTLIIRAAWLLIAVAGMNVLINDITELT